MIAVRSPPVPLDAAVAEGIADTHALAVARRIDLGLDAEAKTTVLGDREALRTLVRNLVDNAVRYTPAGGRVQVRTAQSPQGGAVLEVTDSGPGIPAADRAARLRPVLSACQRSRRAAAGWASPSSRQSPIGTAPGWRSTMPRAAGCAATVDFPGPS